MNNLLKLHASLEIMAHKLKNFHWHVVGYDHFQTHDKLGELIDLCHKSIDDVAELIVQLNEIATCDLNTLKSLSIIAQIEAKRYDSLFIASVIVDDFEKLLDFTTTNKWDMLSQPIIDELNKWILKARWQFESVITDAEEI
ncbi:ferritin-like domain-containing protein [Mycoplasma elephantis]|uniref:ferritin-like domain-containing protein n=1 Tax=Mycoplasma elephantis TaxID=114882 RepID=UPI000482A6F1|nr:ferritin-like domain-containing protein [Mycoplasma elephantis]